MPSRTQHLHALRQQLNTLLSSIDSTSIGRKTGLSPEAASSLHWLQHDPRKSEDGTARVITLAFGDDCAGHHMVRELPSPIDGTSVPVRSVRGAFAGQAHSLSVDVENRTHQRVPRHLGKLAAILRANHDPTRLFALTAGHVIGAPAGSAKGDAVAMTFGGELLLSRFFDCQPNFGALQGPTRIDAGLMQIEASELAPLEEHSDFWPTTWVLPFAKERLRLRTRDKDFTGGGAEYLTCRMRVNAGTPLIYTVTDALCWSAQPGFKGGDSGAPIWSDNDELVAIHMGTTPEGSRANAAAIPIGRILRWANADLVARGENLIRHPVPRSGESLLGSHTTDSASDFDSDVDVLARTMWGEARGEPDPAVGMSAVAHVVYNRVARRTYFGKDIISACRKPFQFSCWNANDPNLPQLTSVTNKNARFALALDIARTLKNLNDAERGMRDTTVGATHYHTRQLQPPPRWARGHTPCARLGNHLFYRDIA